MHPCMHPSSFSVSLPWNPNPYPEPIAWYVCGGAGKAKQKLKGSAVLGGFAGFVGSGWVSVPLNHAGILVPGLRCAFLGVFIGDRDGLYGQ